DENGKRARGDAIVRVFRLAGSELTASVSPARALDVTPKINGRSLTVSAGKVFFRTSEAAMARQTFQPMSVMPSGIEGPVSGNGPIDVSDDGRFVTFVSAQLLPMGSHFEVY